MPIVNALRTLPPGREVSLPGRGTTFVRELAGPPGAATIVLLHGWTATAGVNWATAMDELATRYNVVAIDHRGHGRGLQSEDPFTLEACADDVAAMMDALNIPNAIVAGYSMGGPIAQLLAYRHPDKVGGLVMCATSARFPHSAPVAVPLSMVSKAIAIVQAFSYRQVLPFADRDLYRFIPLADEIGRHNPRVIAEAGPALSHYNATPWLATLGIPAAVVMTTRDQLVDPKLQREMARLLRAHEFKITSLSGHFCAGISKQWLPQLMAAVDDVEMRAPGLYRGPAAAQPRLLRAGRDAGLAA